MILYVYIYFCDTFLLFFVKKKCVFIIFTFFFDKVSSFRNKILTSLKPELIIKKCQWNCMHNIEYNTHFDDYIKRMRPSQMMIFKKIHQHRHIYSLQKSRWSGSLLFCSIILKCVFNNVLLFITWSKWVKRINISKRLQKIYPDLFI